MVMKPQRQWTPARIIFAMLTLLTLLASLAGLAIMFFGNFLFTAPPSANPQPEDVTPLFNALGFGTVLLGLAVTFVASILFLICGVIYLRITKRLRNAPSTPEAQTIKPVNLAQDKSFRP